jgi:hypothetical protein
MNEENLQPKQSDDNNSTDKAVQKAEVVRELVKPDRTVESNPDDRRSPTVQDRGIEVAGKAAVKEPEVIRKLVIPTDSENSRLK